MAITYPVTWGQNWRLIIKEYGPEIIYIIGKDNTVAYAIVRLDFSLKAHPATDKKNWMKLTKHWCVVSNSHNKSSKSSTMDLIHVFANRSDKEEIYPLTVNEIADYQINDKGLQHLKVNS